MGRPAKTLTEEQKIQLEALAALLTIEQIANYFGMVKETFYNIMEREPDVLSRYKKGKSKAIANVAGKLLQQAQEGNLTAIIFYLKTQAKWRETDSEEDYQGEQIKKPSLKIVKNYNKKTG